MQVQIQRLSSTHNCKEFDCGTPLLNEWLATMAGQQEKKYVARTFVLVDGAAQEIVLGFYTLAVSEVGHDAFPNPKKYPKRVPVARLGRFAIEKSLQGKGYGEFLLLNALERVAEISQNAGIAAIVVDAKDMNAANYYRRYAFISTPDNPLQLLLPTATVLAIYNQATTK